MRQVSLPLRTRNGTVRREAPGPPEGRGRATVRIMGRLLVRGPEGVEGRLVFYKS